MSEDNHITQHRYYFLKDAPGCSSVKEYLRGGRGLERFIVQNKIEERRVTVEHPSEIQDLLDAGEVLVIYKVKTNFQDAWRFSRTVILKSENARIEGADLVYKGTPKPLSENNVFKDQIECIQQFMVVGDDEYDLTPGQKERGRSLSDAPPGQRPPKRAPEVVTRPASRRPPKPEHPGYTGQTGEQISDEEAARRANELMAQTPNKSGVNTSLK